MTDLVPYTIVYIDNQFRTQKLEVYALDLSEARTYYQPGMGDRLVCIIPNVHSCQVALY